MKIGIIGAGAIGSAMAGHLVRAGHDVLLSNHRGVGALTDLLHKLGPRARAASREEAALADLVVLAVPWERVPAALAGLPAWNGRILVDATNPVIQPGFRLAELGGRASTEVVASMAAGARVVKAGNTLLAATLARDPREAGGRRVLIGQWRSSAAVPGRAVADAQSRAVGLIQLPPWSRSCGTSVAGQLLHGS
jgi:predicted dinucleotide-binding enzyme